MAESGLDALLDKVDYSGIESYRPSVFAIEFVEFIKMVNGGKPENVTPLFHYKLIDSLMDNTNTLAVCFRGSAKTTLIEYNILYLAVFGRIPKFGDIQLGMYISDTMENGVKNMRNNLEYRYSNSDFLKRYIPKVKFTDPEWEFVNAEGHELTFRGFGISPLTLDTKLYKEDGFTTIGSCNVGDMIYGSDGILTKIVAKSCLHNVPVYRIILEDGRFINVSENHINHIVRKYNSTNGYEYRTMNLTTSELIKLPIRLKGKSEYRLYIPTPKPIQYKRKILPIDPYLLGLLLGDGRLRSDGSCSISAASNDMDFYKTVITEQLGVDYIDKRNGVRNLTIKGISDRITQLGLRGCNTYHKFIPEQYKFGSVEQRLELLRGLMDTDGSINERKRTSKIYFCSTSKTLANDVAELVKSLGGKSTITYNDPKQNQKSKNMVRWYIVSIQINQFIFKLPRKHKIEKIGWHKNELIPIVSIERIEDQPTQCIYVDNDDHLFIASDYVVTHNTGVRGFKKYGIRPQIAYMDDLMSDKNADSKAVTEDIESVVYKAVRQAMHPQKRRIVWLGTPFNMKDPLYKAAGSASWHTVAFPICEKFPCKENEFVPAWPDRFPYDFVKKEYKLLSDAGRVDAFNQELMLRILSDDDRLVQDQDIVWRKRSDVLANLPSCNVYITTDFATSETEKSDFSVISVWALDTEGVFTWIDGIVARQNMAKNMDDLFRLVDVYHPLSTGVEISGQQKGFVNWIKREMNIRNKYFMLATDKASGEEGLRPNTSKLTRFNVALPLFKQRKIAFSEELKDSPAMVEFMTELTSVTAGGFKSQHDDCADTISQLPLLEYFVPGKEVKAASQPEPTFSNRYFTAEEPCGSGSPYIV